MRSNKTGKYRQHAFLLEEMAKYLCQESTNHSLQILTPPVQNMSDEELVNALLPAELGANGNDQSLPQNNREDNKIQDELDFHLDNNNRLGKIYRVSKVYDVMEVLIALSGQATIYDQCQRSEHLNHFQQAYLKKLLQQDFVDDNYADADNKEAREDRIDQLTHMTQKVIKSNLQCNK